MTSSFTIAADDFGLTRGVTDTILETVDKGPVTQVSVIPNGEAVEYAIEEYKKRTPRLILAVHVNLTEGKPLSPREDIPRLVDGHGMFRYSVVGLWVTYLFSLPRSRALLRREVSRELSTQLTFVARLAGLEKIAVNGHQHVHLIPFVYDEIIALPEVSAIRTVRESFIWGGSLVSYIARPVLALLSRRVARLARPRGIRTNDSFIGFVHSGHMTKKAFHTGLARVRGSVEALFHPGSALQGELVLWRDSRADLKWHYSPWRTKEREVLLHFGRNKV